jgi:hypothetical protein
MNTDIVYCRCSTVLSVIYFCLIFVRTAWSPSCQLHYCWAEGARQVTGCAHCPPSKPVPAPAGRTTCSCQPPSGPSCRVTVISHFPALRVGPHSPAIQYFNPSARAMRSLLLSALQVRPQSSAIFQPFRKCHSLLPRSSPSGMATIISHLPALQSSTMFQPSVRASHPPSSNPSGNATVFYHVQALHVGPQSSAIFQPLR